MNQFVTIAKMYNILTNKLKHSPVAVSLLDFHDMVELANEKEVRLRDCLKQLHKKGLVRKVPISQDSGRSRMGYEWVSNKTQPSYKENIAHTIDIINKSTPIEQPADDIRIKVNADHSVTIITKTIRITVEVPL